MYRNKDTSWIWFLLVLLAFGSGWKVRDLGILFEVRIPQQQSDLDRGGF